MNFALVTVSYAPDYERCRLLAESVERLVSSNTRHYIIVDRRDYDLFLPLASKKVQLRVVEDVLPEWISRDETRMHVWQSRYSPPIYNWVLQQLVKLSVFNNIDEDIAIFCDSDNAFIRPFDPHKRFVEDGKLALLRINYQNADLEGWRDTAVNLLGLTGACIPVMNYVGNLIAWRRKNVDALHARIESISGTDWLKAVCQYSCISEYVLYGIFVEHCIGMSAAGHMPYTGKIIKPSWNMDLAIPGKMEEFFNDMDDDYVGVMTHSKDGIPVDSYAEHVRSYWR